MNSLKKSFIQSSKIIKKKGYDYLINPITDGIPSIKPELLKDITTELIKLIKKIDNFDKIVTLESMGIPITSALSLKLNIPFTIIRKRSYGLPAEITVNQVTGYSKSKFFINGVERNEDIIIVDDVLSTGNSLRAVLKALKQMDVNIKGVFVVVDKGNAAEEIKKEFDVDVESLIKISIRNGHIIV